MAALAIVNTLAMNVLEHIREIGILRAIGMQRKQIYGMVLSQSLIIGLVSLIPGIVIGLLIAYMMNLPAEHLTGHRVPFVIQGRLVFMTVVSALLVSVIASFIPARFAGESSF